MWLPLLIQHEILEAMQTMIASLDELALIIQTLPKIEGVPDH